MEKEYSSKTCKRSETWGVEDDERRNDKSKLEGCRFCFLHLDLGIGGAEQLVLNLAKASLLLSRNDDVDIYTTHCDPSHCFEDVKRPNGILCENVHVLGRWIPKSILGTALCSTIRMLYITAAAILINYCYHSDQRIIYVVDVLPTPLVLLRAAAHFFPPLSFFRNKYKNPTTTIYYCHFPDQLLTRDTVNGFAPMEQLNKTSNTGTVKKVINLLKFYYRLMLNSIEALSMPYADLICVNSKFTQEKVLQTFPSLISPSTSCENNIINNNGIDEFLKVLYPPVRTTEATAAEDDCIDSTNKEKETIAPILSVNRYERKKNVAILIQAYAHLLVSNTKEDSKNQIRLPPLIIAGGYDVNNDENVQYYRELQDLAKNFTKATSVKTEGDDYFSTGNGQIIFKRNLSDEERNKLLHSSLVVCYTPKWEHFGIVPLEAMDAATPVLAWDCGGPKETVCHKETGYLVPLMSDGDDIVQNETNAWAEALQYFIQNPLRATQLGNNAKHHVHKNFAWDQFVTTWELRILQAQYRSHQRVQNQEHHHFFGSILFLLVFLILMILFHQCIISSNNSTTIHSSEL